jgi:hypothetical protein
MTTTRCFRNQLLVIGSQLILAKDVTLYFELAGCCEAKFGHNLLLSKSLGRLDQQLLTEAPLRLDRLLHMSIHFSWHTLSSILLLCPR